MHTLYTLHRLLLWVVLLTLLPEPGQGQSTDKIELHLQDSETGQAIEQAIVRLLDAQGTTVTYTISNNKGSALLSLGAKGESLSIRAMGYAVESIPLSQIRHNHIIKLKPKATTLQTIVVKTEPIKLRGDTVSYRASSFATAGDHYLEDILKRMPGIEVASNGAISYQGKPINKFYIEELDLLGTNYTQASQNLPHQAISEVQVLERHQPIRMLEGKMGSEQAALNIKLKDKYRSKLIGELATRIGASPLLLEGKGFATRLGRGVQTLALTQGNNTGSDLYSQQGESLDYYTLETFAFSPTSVLNERTPSVDIAPYRYIHNHSGLISLNHLTKLDSTATLRFLLGADQGRSTSTSSTETRYESQTPFSLLERDALTNRHRRVNPTITYERNASSGYLKGELRGLLERKGQDLTLQSNGKAIGEETQSPRGYLQARAIYSLLRGRWAYNINSLVYYYDSHEHLRVSDARSLQSNSQDYNYKSWVEHTVLKASVPLARQGLNIALSQRWEGQAIGSSTLSIHTIGLEAQTTWHPTSSSYINLSLPLKVAHISLSPIHTHHSKVLYAPSLSTSQKLGSKYSLDAKLNWWLTPDMALPYLPDPLWRDYRSLQLTSPHTHYTQALKGELSLNYRNLSSAFFGSVSVSYSYRSIEQLTDYTLTQDHTLVSYRDEASHPRTLQTNLNLDKSLIDIGLSLKLQAYYQHSLYDISTYSTTSHRQQDKLYGSTTLLYKVGQRFSLSYTLSALNQWRGKRGERSNFSQVLAQTAEMRYQPSIAWSGQISYQWRGNRQPGIQRGHSAFLDAQISYRKNKRWQLSLVGHNLLGTTRYILYSTSEINSTYNVVPLRGREVIARLTLHL